MNLLPRKKRIRIVRLKAEGRTIREIAGIVGCSRETVSGYVGAKSDQRKEIRRLVEAIWDALEQQGVEPSEIDPLVELEGLIRFTCPFHPEAEPEEDIDFDTGDCRLCKSDGLVRHHVRRKAEGRPIVPPRRARRAPMPSEPARASTVPDWRMVSTPSSGASD